MRVAALYDVHGNLPALEAVLEELDDELILVGGDAVAGPWPSETLECLRAVGHRVRFIRGNADRGLARGSEPPSAKGGPPPAVLAHVRASLDDDQIEFLEELAEGAVVEVDGLGLVRFCHATPRSDEEILTGISPDERWLRALGGCSERLVVCGHTHVQFDRTVGDVRIVNAGSVGMPYEDEPGAYWAMLGPEVELRRTEYDVEAAAAAVRAAGWPEEWPSATPEDATEFFERLSRERD